MTACHPGFRTLLSGEERGFQAEASGEGLGRGGDKAIYGAGSAGLTTRDAPTGPLLKRIP